MKTGPELLESYEDNWVTDVGAWFPGERVVFRGEDLLNGLADLEWLELILFGITGRKFSESEVALVSKVFLLATSFPEPRLWNNRIAALGATVRTTGNLAISAANAASEATIYGCRPIIKAMDMLERSLQATNAGKSLQEFLTSEVKERRVLPGYGRPLVRHDERISPLLREASRLGKADGEYTCRALDIAESSYIKRIRLKMNVAALAAGLFADIGITPRQHYYLSCFTFLAGIAPCYLGAVDKVEGSFFPLQCDRINSVGTQRLRIWGKQ